MDIDTWTVVDSYFQSDKNILTKHQLESYNDFIYNKIPNTIKSLNPFIIFKNDDETEKLKYEIRVYVGGMEGDLIYFEKPNINSRMLVPNEARLKNITYKSKLSCDIDIQYIVYDTDGDIDKDRSKTKTFKNIKIGSIPVMLHSKLCALHNQPTNVLRELGECVNDQGGYFVIDGKEKVIVAQERIATNRLFLNKSKDKDFTYEGLIRCTTEEAAIFPKTINVAVFSDQYLKGKRKNAIIFTLPNIKREIPLFMLFRALGVESDKSILEHIVSDINDPSNKQIVEFLQASMVDGSFLHTQEQVLEFLKGYDEHGYNNVDYVRYVIMNDLFPNMNEGSGKNMSVSLHKKALFLGHVAKHIVQVCLGLEKESDRDNYAFKRVDVSGFLMANLFRDFYNQFRVECRSAIDRKYNYGPWKKEGDITQLVTSKHFWEVFRSDFIEDGFRRSLKGQWGINQDPSKAGIVQDLSRISFIGTISNLRRVNTPVDRSIKIVAPHRLHPTQFGYMCPCESPDGASIGLLKNFALLAHVSFDASSKEIIKCLDDLGITMLEYISPQYFSDDVVKVLVNSNLIGITHSPHKLVEKMKLLRRNALINVMTSVSWNILQKEININTEAGRCTRPLFIVDKNRLRINKMIIQLVADGKKGWYDLIKGDLRKEKIDITDQKYYDPFTILGKKRGDKQEEHEVWELLKKTQSVIEFIDVEESNTCMIAMEFKDLTNHMIPYTHCEIHPSSIFAVLTANIPFANHNQAPRNYFSGAQGKQAIGIYSTAFNSRMDTASLVLHYPQKRIVNTRYMDYIGSNNMPNGENAIVAIMTYTGYNQEDSVIINRAAIDKGMFNLTYYKTLVEKEDSDIQGVERIIFDNPAQLSKDGNNVEGFGKRFANYTKVDKDGFPVENSRIREGDVYLGRCLVKTTTVEDETDDSIFQSKKKTNTYSDKSLVADKNMYGTVDKVYVFDHKNNGNEKMRTCKIRMRKVRTPVLGDKVGSSHAQKGVIGMIVQPEDMPYTKDGIVPDLIINPHAIPTRMTIAHLMECVFAKLGCIEGKFYDATPFCYQNVETAYEGLQQHGFERYGNEILYNGITGEQMPTEIFMGPTFYIRMKHMVQDKINSRHPSESTYTGLTRQPVKSRAKGGGLRIGEMESGAIVSHGMSAFLKESMMERSDKYSFFIDNSTGDIAIASNNKGFARSLVEKDNADFSKVETPFAAKLLLQELQTMSIMPRIITYDSENIAEDDDVDYEEPMMYSDDEEININNME